MLDLFGVSLLSSLESILVGLIDAKGQHQADLVVSFGGLGLHHASDVILPAFLESQVMMFPFLKSMDANFAHAHLSFVGMLI